MTIAWTLYVLLVGTLLALAANAVDGLARRMHLPTRWAWVCALAGTIGFATVAPQRADSAATYAYDLVPTRTAAAGAEVGHGTSISALLERARTAARSASDRMIAEANRTLSPRSQAALAIAWAVASGMMLIGLVAVNRRVRRERHAWPRAEVFGTPVRITPGIGPAVIGLSKPEIVVPRWLLERQPEEQRLVIVHEREHVAARDQVLLVGAMLVAALLPWHPAVWWALTRLRLAIELDCDARVLTHGVQARPYGALLIDIAGECAGHRAGALALADRPSHLERRLLAMKNTRPRFLLVRTCALGALATLSVLVACEARMPTSAEVERMDVAGAEKAVLATMVPDKPANVIYTVDGVTVTKEQAYAIKADRIATMNIAKGTKQGGMYRIVSDQGVKTQSSDSGAVYTYVNVRMNDSTSRKQPMTVTFQKGSKEPQETATRVALKQKATAIGLLYIDGVKVPSSAMEHLDPKDIASVEVLKGAAATQVSLDPGAANGIVMIVTKRGKQ